jgi:hypothetical protein
MQVIFGRLFRRSTQARPKKDNKSLKPPAEIGVGGRQFYEPPQNVNFPIDVVYTWVDAEDPVFQEELSRYLPKDACPRTTGRHRYECHEELRYSLRSIHQFAPWVNHIFIVTNGQRPVWLANHPKITVVHHKDILDDAFLPTFNSHVIGSALHNIPNLSEHYIYFNDDVMLMRQAFGTDFFTSSGLAYAFLGNLVIPDSPPAPSETATFWAAKNARNLIRDRFRWNFSRRMTHTAHPQVRSVAKEAEQVFSSEYRLFRANRFRAMDDILVASYMNPVLAYIKGRALFVQQKMYYVKIQDPRAPSVYQRILVQRNSPSGRLVACFNDFHLPDAPSDFREAFMAFARSYFLNPSPFEKQEINLLGRTA